ncbi:MAG: GHMP kinase [Bryobacteraceae bacterium]
MDEQPRVINSIAPIRVCDNGGWTDTWFARHGKVFSVAVSPYVEVQMKVHKPGGDRPRIIINAENYGERYAIAKPNGCYDKHPLIEAAMDYASIPKDVAIEVSIFSEAPPGCSTGTSAAVSVALLGALDCLTPGRMTPYQVAMAAFHVETQLLKQQCGIQDQISSAHGGINFIDMHEYPHASVSQLSVSEAMWWELESRLVLIFVGSSHSSSDVHLRVIRGLERAGMDSPQLEALRRCAVEAKEALYAADLVELGRSMIRNTEAQAGLHPDLVGPHHQEVIDIAREHGALGWKVNGAGGGGGSVSILCHPDRSRRREMIRAITSVNPDYQHIPVSLSRHGLRVWEPPARGAAEARAARM